MVSVLTSLSSLALFISNSVFVVIYSVIVLIEMYLKGNQKSKLKNGFFTDVRLVPAIVISEGDSMKENADEEEEEEKGEEEEEKKGRAPPSCLLDILNQIKLGELEQVRIGDLHIVEPYSEECSQLIALCLTWKLILHMCGCSSSELRYKYATYLTDSGLMSRLMDNIFCIIPHASLQQVDLEQRWTPDVQLTLKGLQDLAVEVYSWALKYMPAVVRRWCNNADKRTATFVEKFTCKYAPS